MARIARDTLILLILLATAAGAQVDRSKRPPAGPAPKAAFPDYSTSTLKNGLRVFVVQNHEQPLVTFNIALRTGSAFDGAKPGTADLVCDLLTKGTARRSSIQFAREEDFIGVSIGATAEPDQMSVSGGGLKKYAEKILDLMTDALFAPSFPQDELEKSRKQMLSALQYEKSDPASLLKLLQNSVIFNRHPYARFATEASAKAITREDLVRFHSAYFMPNNASLAVVGDVTPAEILPLVEKYFGSWKKGTLPAAGFPAPEPLKGVTVHIVDRPGSVQSNIAVAADGMVRKNPDYPHFFVLNAILGGGSTGRLYTNLREKHGFTYGAYSGMDARKMSGCFSAMADVRLAATDSAIGEMLAEMRRLRSEPLGEEERAMNVNYLVGQFLMSLENAGQTATRVQNIDLYGLPKDYYKRFVQNTESFTSRRASELAKKYLPTDRLAILLVRDAKVLKPKLERFGPVTVYDTDIKPVRENAGAAVGMRADEIIDKYIAALGGLEALDKITSRKIEGTLTVDAMGQSMHGDFLQYEKAPNKQYQKFSLPMGTQEVWVDGATAVRSTGGEKEVLSGTELAETLEDAAFLDFLHYKEIGVTLEVKGEKSVDGAPAYAVEVRKKSGKASTLYFDAKSFLLVMDEKMEGPPGKGVLIATKYGDYKTVGGMQIPHTIRQTPMGATVTISVTSCQVNADLPDSLFRPE